MMLQQQCLHVPGSQADFPVKVLFQKIILTFVIFDNSHCGRDLETRIGISAFIAQPTTRLEHRSTAAAT